MSHVYRRRRWGVQQQRRPHLLVDLALAWAAGFVVLFAAAAFVLAFGGRAKAQEFGDYGVGHAQFHLWYDTGERGGPLMRPHQPKTPCCNGDCRPTKAIYREGRWHVWADRGWVLVPLERMKTDVPAPNTTAHVCASRRFAGSDPEIFCFIPPNIEG